MSEMKFWCSWNNLAMAKTDLIKAETTMLLLNSNRRWNLAMDNYLCLWWDKYILTLIPRHTQHIHVYAFFFVPPLTTWFSFVNLGKIVYLYTIFELSYKYKSWLHDTNNNSQYSFEDKFDKNTGKCPSYKMSYKYKY